MPEIVRILLAVAVALVLYLIGVKIVRVMLAPAPPDEPDLSALRPVNYRYRCMVCGTEVTMTASPVAESPDVDAPGADAPDAPRHCREDMHLLGASAPT